MKFPSPRVVILILLSLVASCERAPTPEEIRGDELLEKARDYIRKGMTGDARSTLLQLFVLETRNERKERLAEITESLAETYRAGARFDSAFYYYDESYAHYRSLADKYASRRVRLAAAGLRRQLGEEEQALTMVTEMIRIAEVVGDIQGITELNWTLIPIYRSLGYRKEEEEALGNLLNTATEARSQAMQARVYAEWGDAYHYRGDLPGAVQNYITALGLASKAGEPSLEVMIRSKLATLYGIMGSRGEAFNTFTDGLLQADSTSGAELVREQMLIRVGNIYLEGQEYRDADRFYEAALQSAMRRGDRLMEGYLLLQRGHCAVGLKPRSPASLNDYQLALDLFTSYDYNPGIGFTQASFGMAALAAGKPVDALTYLRSAVQTARNPGTVTGTDDLAGECEASFFRLHDTTLDDAYLGVMLQLGQYEDAFSYLDSLHAGRIAEALRSFKLETGRQLTTAALWNVRHAWALRRGTQRQQRLFLESGAKDPFLFGEVKGSLEQGRRLQRKADEQLDEAGSGGLETLVKGTSLGIPEVRGALPKNTVLVTYIPTPRSVFIYAIRGDGWTVQLSSVQRATIDRMAEDFRSMLGESRDQETGEELPPPNPEPLATSLYGVLLRPVRSSLEGVSHVLVIPFDEVIPLHALKPPGRNARYLIEDVGVSYIPSASSLLLPDSTATATGPDIIALGHPGNTAWDVEYELRDIQAFHKQARLYFGQAATMVTLRNEHATVLHLAAEFSYDAARPGNSFVWLSDGKTSGGKTRVQWGQFFSLPVFPTVICSDLSDHRGIPSVKPLLFLGNGSRSVIMTLAPTHRKTKKFFGELFYTSVVAGGSGRDGYRTAMRGMIQTEEYRSLTVWAPFCLWGL